MIEEQRQAAYIQSSSKLVFERMIQAANRHDLDAMVACFAPDFRSEQPFYPERNFTGQAGVRKNWSFFFSTMPDFRAEVQSLVVEGNTVWAELAYYGTQADGKKHVTRGVSISGIKGEQITWSKLYIVTTVVP
ncbi:MAG TPA: nuclear transport factor 2 family protein [Ktedonobacteraceae bacterium]|nr:nuclear transport factor 2 family protein [Ktedonobacteraceae bacterium]